MYQILIIYLNRYTFFPIQQDIILYTFQLPSRNHLFCRINVHFNVLYGNLTLQLAAALKILV